MTKKLHLRRRSHRRTVAALMALIGLVPARLAAQPATSDVAEVVIVVQHYINALMARDTSYMRTAWLERGTVVVHAIPTGASTRPRVLSVDEIIAATAARAAQFTGRVWAPVV